MADIRDLISRCEQAEIFIQDLNENTVSADIRGIQGKITFTTNPDFIFEGLEGKPRQAFVVWLPTDVFERQEKYEKEQKTEGKTDDSN